MRKLAFSLLVGIAAPGSAEVIAVSETGMESRTVVQVAVSPARVWATLVRPARWWSAAHSWSGDGANLALDPRPGGCFCERLAGGGGVEHMRVIHSAPGSLLRLSGALGPLQEEAVTGTLSFALATVDGGTRLTVTYRLSGQRRGGFAPLASAVDQVIGEQVERLARAAADRD